MNAPSIITRVNIWRQDLKELTVTWMGYVHNIAEAKNMLRVFIHCDKDAISKGECSYFFTCEEKKI